MIQRIRAGLPALGLLAASMGLAGWYVTSMRATAPHARPITPRFRISWPLDLDFGPIGQLFPSASSFWVYHLVDVWPPSQTGFLAYDVRDVTPEARLTAADLLRRVEPDVAGAILEGREPMLRHARDELTAGLVWWALQYRAERLAPGGKALDYRRMAERALSLAARAGDPVQRSYARLASAFCALRSPYEDYNALKRLGHISGLDPRAVRGDMAVCESRLVSVYTEFKDAVPERALRAAAELRDRCFASGRAAEGSEWQDRIRTRLSGFRDWGSYGPVASAAARVPLVSIQPGNRTAAVVADAPLTTCGNESRGTVTNYDTLNGQIIGENTGGVQTNYMFDALGSVVGTKNSSGVVLNTYRHKPYGGLLAKTGTAADPKFLWNGGSGYRATQRAHSDYYVRARHYAAPEGAWISTDLIWPRQRSFGYAASRPVVKTDPTGMICAACSESGVSDPYPYISGGTTFGLKGNLILTRTISYDSWSYSWDTSCDWAQVSNSFVSYEISNFTDMDVQVVCLMIALIIAKIPGDLASAIGIANGLYCGSLITGGVVAGQVLPCTYSKESSGLLTTTSWDFYFSVSTAFSGSGNSAAQTGYGEMKTITTCGKKVDKDGYCDGSPPLPPACPIGSGGGGGGGSA